MTCRSDELATWMIHNSSSVYTYIMHYKRWQSHSSALQLMINSGSMIQNSILKAKWHSNICIIRWVACLDARLLIMLSLMNFSYFPSNTFQERFSKHSFWAEACFPFLPCSYQQWNYSTPLVLNFLSTSFILPVRDSQFKFKVWVDLTPHQNRRPQWTFISMDFYAVQMQTKKKRLQDTMLRSLTSVSTPAVKTEPSPHRWFL